MMAMLLSGLWAVAQDQTFTVSGEVRSDVKEVIITMRAQKPVEIARVPVQSGLFSYTGTQPKDAVLGVGTDKYYQPFVNDGTPLQVFFVDNVNGDMKVEGMPLLVMAGSDQNIQFAKADREISKYNDEFSATLAQLQAQATPDNLEQLQEQAMAASQKAIDGMVAELMKYRSTLIPVAYLPDLSQMMTYSQLKEFMTPDAPYYNHPQLEQVKSVFEAMSLKQPGQPYHDVTANDMYGREHKLSEYCGKGNYVLVDFWASWCGPCRQEMPTVVECYNLYHGKKNFEVVGISLDEKEGAWKAAVTKLGMAWPQLCDLKGWSSPAAAAYGVQAIPSNVLVDPQGQIIATDLRGEQLKATLAELFE